MKVGAGGHQQAFGYHGFYTSGTGGGPIETTASTDGAPVDMLGPPHPGRQPYRGEGENYYQVATGVEVPMPSMDYGDEEVPYEDQVTSPNDGDYGTDTTVQYPNGPPPDEWLTADAHSEQAMGWGRLGKNAELFETQLDPTKATGQELMDDVGIHVHGDAFAYDSYEEAQADMKEEGWDTKETGLVLVRNGNKQAYVLFDPYVPDLKPVKQKDGSLIHAPDSDFVPAVSTAELHLRLRAVIHEGAIVDVRKLDYAVANDMLRSLEDTHQVFPDVTKSIRSITKGFAFSSKEYVAAVRERSNGGGSDLMWDGPLTAGGAKGGRIGYIAAQQRPGSHWFVGTVEGSFNHELGHVTDNVARAQNGWVSPNSDEHASKRGSGQSSNDLIPRNYRHYMAEAGSAYGGTNTRESFAELFSLWRATGRVPPAMEPFFYSVLGSLSGVSKRPATEPKKKTRAPKTTKRAAAGEIIVVDGATAIFPDGTTISYNFYGPGTEDMVREAAEADWPFIQRMMADEQKSDARKALDDLQAVLDKAGGMKRGGGGKMQVFGPGGLYGSGSPGDYGLGASFGPVMPSDQREKERVRLEGHGEGKRGPSPEGEFEGKVWAERTTVQTRKQVYVNGKSEWVVTPDTPSWATNGDPKGNSTNPLTKESISNLGKLGYKNSDSAFAKMRKKLNLTVAKARDATPDEVASFRKLDAKCKAGNSNACRQIRGESYHRRDNKNRMLKDWGDGHTVCCAHCGVRLGYAQLELDKMIPAVRYKYENLVPSCGTCNTERPGGSKAREVWKTKVSDLPAMFKSRRGTIRGRKVKTAIVFGDVQQPEVSYTAAVRREAYEPNEERVVPVEVTGGLTVIEMSDPDTDQWLWTSYNIGGWSVVPATIRQTGGGWGAVQAG